MRARTALLLALVCAGSACGGSEFDDAKATGGSGGSATGGGGGTGGGSGGSGGSTAGSGGGGAPTGGASGSSGDSGVDGSAGDASSDGAAGDASTGGSAGDAGAGDADAGPPPIAVVQVTPTSTHMTDDVPTITLLSAPKVGNSIIVGVTCISDFQIDCTIPTNGVTDNQGNTYTQVAKGEPILSSAQGARSYIYIAEHIGAPSGTFTISVNPNGTVPPNIQQVAWGAIEVSGLAASPTLDATGNSPVGGTTQVSTTVTTDLATKQANELAVAVLSMRSNDTNMLITPETTWVSHHAHQNGSSGPPGHSMVSKILSATGKISHTWTHDPPTRGVAGTIATFKGAATN